MSWSGALVPSSSIYVIAEDVSVEVDELLDVPVDATDPPPPPQAVKICERPIVATSDCRRLRFFFL
jgi:hypothetical protein